MQTAYDENRKVVWLDEIIFTKSTNTTHEWSKRKHNYSIPCESLGSKYTVVFAAIILFKLYDEAVSHELFIAFIEKLVEINSGS